MSTVTLTLNQKQIDLLHALYKEDESKAVHNAYIVHQYRPMDCVITLYTSNKAVFQGNSAEEYAAPFALYESDDELFEEHAGSDEVGTGDVFGPVCVCAAIVHKDDAAFLKKLGVRDSKKMSDEEILKTAPQITEKVCYSLLILNNRKYNEVIQTNNLNEIKAKMHNQAYLNLEKKEKLPDKIVIDQFCEKSTYYRYLRYTEEVVTDIYFTPRAEDQYLAVACGAIISRYAFLKTLESMENEYDFHFHKGAGSLVDEDIRRFISQHSKEALKNVAKMNFKNIQTAIRE